MIIAVSMVSSVRSAVSLGRVRIAVADDPRVVRSGCSLYFRPEENVRWVYAEL